MDLHGLAPDLVLEFLDSMFRGGFATGPAELGHRSRSVRAPARQVAGVHFPARATSTMHGPPCIRHRAHLDSFENFRRDFIFKLPFNDSVGSIRLSQKPGPFRFWWDKSGTNAQNWPNLGESREE